MFVDCMHSRRHELGDLHTIRAMVTCLQGGSPRFRPVGYSIVLPVNANKPMLQVALPVLLSLDMVHNFYVVAMLAQARQKVSFLHNVPCHAPGYAASLNSVHMQEWADEDNAAMLKQGVSALRLVAQHCRRKDRELWPETALLALPAAPAEAEAEAATSVQAPGLLSEERDDAFAVLFGPVPGLEFR